MKILALKNEPKSCSECKLCETTELVLDYYNESHRCLFNPDICIKERYEDRDNEVEFSPNDFEFMTQRHPQCPLISIDLDYYKDVVEILNVNEMYCEARTIEDLLTKLRGK